MSASLKAIHVGVRQLGFDDEMKRGLYKRITRKTSAKDMTEAERESVVSELRKLGFKKSSNTRSDGRKKLEGAFAKKLQALWIAAWNLGIAENRDDAAMLAFVKRQTKLDHTRFLRHPEDATKAIEGLKAWMAREANVDWTANSHYNPDDGMRIALAQYKILNRNAELFDCSCFWRFVCDLAGFTSPSQFEKTRSWVPVMNELGERIRKQKAAA